jgi:hypothetical protein
MKLLIRYTLIFLLLTSASVAFQRSGSGPEPEIRGKNLSHETLVKPGAIRKVNKHVPGYR